jgi:tRNA pseudouridine13 synthase
MAVIQKSTSVFLVSYKNTKNTSKMVSMKLNYLHVTRAKGTGGFLESPEDFVVREAIDKKFFSKYSRQNKVKLVEGRNSLLLVKKRNMTTHKAVEIIADKYGINKKDISYAGLKDKFAVTEQYMTMKKAVEGFKEKDIEVEVVGKTNRMISIGDLLENNFEITLHNCRNQNMTSILKEISEKGIPNYFGLQRFGFNKNNHVVGKLLIKRKFSLALELINRNYNEKFKDIRDVNKRRLKFFINAYQSFLFNETLNEVLRTKKKVKEISIIGSDTKISGIIKKLLRKEGIDPKDFAISDLRISCTGSIRKAFVYPKISYKINGEKVSLLFSLPKGSYATVVIREIAKKEVRKQ